MTHIEAWKCNFCGRKSMDDKRWIPVELGSRHYHACEECKYKLEAMVKFDKEGD